MCLLTALNTWVIVASRAAVHGSLDALPDNEVGLLLGTSRYTSDGGPNPHFYGRIEAAVELLRVGKVRRLLVSGDRRTRRYNEPAAMKRALMERGVPEQAIMIDNNGLRTLDSIVRAKEVFGLSRMTIISQRYHNYRAIFIAQRHQLEAVAYCAPTLPWRTAINAEARELLARAWAVVDLYLLDTRPEIAQ